MGRSGASAPSVSNMTSTSSSLTSSIPESEREWSCQFCCVEITSLLGKGGGGGGGGGMGWWEGGWYAHQHCSHDFVLVSFPT